MNVARPNDNVMITSVMCSQRKKKRFSKCLIFRKTANISVNQQSQYTIRNLIPKLAPNWLTNVKVIDLTVFLGQALSGKNEEKQKFDLSVGSSPPKI